MWTMTDHGQRRVRVGLIYLAGTGAAYAVCILILAAGGDRPGSGRPWQCAPR
jgi:hypothetical protein